MTGSSIIGVIATLALVLGLLAIALRMLRRFTMGTIAGRARLPMEVVQRLPLGPRQGVAVVRIGERVLAVSMGDGGVRPLMELGEEERRELLAPAAPPLVALAGLGLKDFRSLLRNAVRSAAVVLLLASAMGAPRSASAQSSARATTSTSASAPAPSRATASRADSMISRLAPQIDLRLGQQKGQEGGLRLSGTVGVVVVMGLLTLLPTLLLMMTGFTRILIVLHFLKQALGTQSAPPAHLISALALLITGFVMAPTLRQVNEEALQPWMDGKIEQAQMMSVGVKPFRTFMFKQTRDHDITTFLQMSATQQVKSEDDVPLVVLMSAFVTSELRTAFQIGFALFLPFIVIDVVVSSVLMSMGMFMLPPAMISLPFKLLLFVLVDGWSLVVQSLISSFH